ncbi:ArsR/SmtB family transcription factor [Oceaniglobus indicus]|uniref:ArsR/SmtB family transcription factor n=1 Tax=Oceaniglobus indicus TaxID=2047749 RepID=UPI000C1876D9|nr:metalloregulator ArsR/SmtB family transcription factor [Oceaniglobus indicus]
MKHPTDHTLSVEQAASTFAALGSEQRLGVLRTLVRAGPEGLSIGALGEASGVTGSTLTHHLRILTQAELIRQTRQGRSTICAAADYAHVETLSRYLLTECCADTTSDSRDDHAHD